MSGAGICDGLFERDPGDPGGEDPTNWKEWKRKPENDEKETDCTKLGYWNGNLLTSGHWYMGGASQAASASSNIWDTGPAIFYRNEGDPGEDLPPKSSWIQHDTNTVDNGIEILVSEASTWDSESLEQKPGPPETTFISTGEGSGTASTETIAASPEEIKKGQICWAKCKKGGLCSCCGVKKALCRIGFDKTNARCNFGKIGGRNQHICVDAEDTPAEKRKGIAFTRAHPKTGCARVSREDREKKIYSRRYQ